MDINQKNRHMDCSLDIVTRVTYLLSLMTKEEKLAQLLSLSEYGMEMPTLDTNGELIRGVAFDHARVHGIGAYQVVGKNRDPCEYAEYANALQKDLIEKTRLGIPAILHDECLHGQMSPGSTVFPQAISMACTWDAGLVHDIHAAIAAETRSKGAHLTHSPVLDISRDPRWGRMEETYGEDPYLASELAVAAVSGLQGGTERISDGHVIASPKHFAGFAMSAGGRDSAPVELSERYMRDVVLAPFKAAVTRGHAQSIMASYVELDGIPCHANRWLLNDVLREEWGFKGVVESDFYAVKNLCAMHHLAIDIRGAACKALDAGVDMDLPDGDGYRELLDMINQDEKVENQINRAVSRILRLKFMMGLFENPWVDPAKAVQISNCPTHVALARKAAEKAIVLLKNEKEILPLDLKHIKSIAIIGPNANRVEYGGYTIRNDGITILDAMRTRIDSRIELRFEKGCNITNKEDRDDLIIHGFHDSNTTLCFSLQEEESMISRAVDIAGSADVAIVCLGESHFTANEGGGDRSSLDMVGNQVELLKRVHATGTPVVVVLVHGRTNAIGNLVEFASAILDAGYLGEEGSNAITEALLGDINPGGKLPVSIPKSAGHLPAYYCQKRSGKQRGYVLDGPDLSYAESVYPFGYGLSYTKFEYNHLQIRMEHDSTDLVAIASVLIRNVGSRKGDEVVQMYIRDMISSVTRPDLMLRGFNRITLDPGESKSIEFAITRTDLSFTGIDYKSTLEPGEYEVMIGCDSSKYLKTSFLLTDTAVERDLNVCTEDKKVSI